MTEGLTAETAATKQRLSAEARQLDRANARGIDSGRPMNTSTSSTKPDHPNPQSQSLSRSYGSNLPTSLTYIVLSTRGCAPRRPAADMGTAWHEIHTVSVGFSRADENAPDIARAAMLYGAKVPISGQADSRDGAPYKEKKTLPGAPADVSHFVCVTAHCP